MDDWEWGVDLFADDPVVFKKLIYEMRFDEVSAVYALFGQFFIGVRLPVEKLGGWLERKADGVVECLQCDSWLNESQRDNAARRRSSFHASGLQLTLRVQAEVGAF